MTNGDALLGQTLDGKYRIEALVGRGGMGAVYRATHLGTGRTVGVKVILPELVRNPEALERFRREARVTGGLRHPNIVDVTDFGTTSVGGSDVAYLVMEYLSGKTVRDVLKEQGRLPLVVAVDIVEQIALALDEAHRHGVVHRDLKPDNVWLIPDPRGGHVVRVLDFGIAKLLQPDLAGDVDPPGTARQTGGTPVRITDDVATQALSATPSTVAPAAAGDAEETISTPDGVSRSSTALTALGTTLGTPAYMSPEQCRGEEVDFRSDLYSLGILAWEAIAGRKPFDGTLGELVRKHLEARPPRLDEVVPGTPPLVAGAVDRALSKDPAARHPSARAMAGSLRVGAESAGAIVRHAVALYSERLDSFLPLSVRLSWPGLLFLLPFGVASFFVGTRFLAPVLSIGCMGSWGLVTATSNAGFALAVDRLRRKPFEDVRPAEILDDMRRRLSLAPDAGRLRLLARLFAFYLRCEFGAKRAGTGDLAFLVVFLEGSTLAEAYERVHRLASVTRASYNWIRGWILAALFVIPFFEGAALYPIARLFLPGNRAALLAPALSMLLIPVNAVFVNPVFSSALAMLFFRARQASGEDVPLSAILPTRL